MRLPDILGVLAAVIVGALVLVYVFQLSIVAVVAPTPTSPTAPPISLLTPEPEVTPPPDSPDATASAGPSAPPSSPTPEPTFDQGVAIGMHAPTFALPELGGGTIDTAQLAGRPLWLNFMATWCDFCAEELPMMELMQSRLGDQMTILIVDVEEDEATVRRKIRAEWDVDLPVALDLDGSVYRQWGYVLPAHYFIDGEGVLRDVIFGGAPRDAFVESVTSLVPDADLGE